MTKAKLVSAAVALSIILGNAAARASDDHATKPTVDSTIQGSPTQAAPAASPDANASLAGLVSKYAMGDMAELGGMLIGDMPPPSQSTGSPMHRRTENLAVAAPDAAPSLEKHMGTAGAPDLAMGPPGISHAGMAMGGGHMMAHARCPLALLDGPNALSDDQYQKLYDIKGQFITSVVPKGLNMYVLVRKMQDLLTAPSMDTQAVKDLEKQISSSTSDISMTVMDSLVSASQVLTQEQRKELHRRLIQAEVGGGWQHHHEAPHPEK